MRPRSLATAALTTAAICAAALLAPATAAGAAETTDVPSGRTEFRKLADYESDMKALAREHPNLVKTFTMPYTTTSGRTVMGIEITRNVKADDGKPVFADVGMHHGNENPSGDLTLEFAMDLVRNARDPRVAGLLDEVRLVVVPVVNVDGLVRGRRQTDTNTDMNRNYGLGWAPIPTGGAAPWSEPETRNMEWLLSTRQATVFNTQHTCIQVVLYPPLELKAGPAQDRDRLHSLASKVAARYGPGYRALPSAEDYETTGEAIDWAYYATRGLSLTTETCPDEGVERTYRTQVADTYPEHRQAMLEMMRTAADPAEHATITGKAPKGAVLRVAKAFDMYTNPYAQPDGTTRPSAFSTRLTSDMTARDGRFSWAVNPSYRPVPAYQEDGVHGDHSGFYTEPWVLTCERPDGKVLQTTEVNVGLGRTAKVDLRECAAKFHRG